MKEKIELSNKKQINLPCRIYTKKELEEIYPCEEFKIIDPRPEKW